MSGALEFLRSLTQRPVGFAGVVGVTFFLVLTYLGPLVIPLMDSPDLSQIYRPPSFPDHPLGTDNQGRDVLNQIVYGGRDILSIAFLAAGLSTLMAVGLGSLSATLGGRVDQAVLALTDVALTVPRLVLLIVVAAIVRPTSFWALAGLLAVFQCWSLLRQVRAQVLSLRERDYVEAARSLDLGLFHIIFREMLPTMRSYVAIHFILAMTDAIYAQAGLVILGLIPLTSSNWGIMLYVAYTQGALFFRDSLWYILSPILAISLFQLSLVSLASALEDIFNPRLRTS